MSPALPNPLLQSDGRSVAKFPLSPAAERAKYFPLASALSGMAWPDVASRYRGLLTSYLAKDPSSHLHRLAAVTVGFDDGDLERVR